MSHTIKKTLGMPKLSMWEVLGTITGLAFAFLVLIASLQGGR